MTSRKRVRTEDDVPNFEDGERIRTEELEPSKKKPFLNSDAESHDGGEIANGMDIEYQDAELSMDSWKALWTPFASFCSWVDLLTLRRVCKLFHTLIGPSFLSLSKFRPFPDPSMPWDSYVNRAKTVEIFRNSKQTFASIDPDFWPFWCSQSLQPIEESFLRPNVHTFHLSTTTLLPGQALQRFGKLTTITVDFVMAFAAFAPAPYQGIEDIVILPPRENILMAFFQRLKQTPGLPLELSPDDTPLACFAHFGRLLCEGFEALHRLSIIVSTWDELNFVLEALVQRETQPESCAPLTHLLIGATPNFQLPEGNADLSLFLLRSFSHLEELWIDPNIFNSLELDSLSLGPYLRHLQVSFSGEPPMCLCIDGEALECLKINALEGSMITIDTASTANLSFLDIASTTQTISLLLNSLVDNPPPHLHTINLNAVVSEGMETPRFEVLDLPSLTSFSATFAADDDSLQLDLYISGSQLRTLTLDIEHNITVQRFELDPTTVLKLRSLSIASPHSPRQSALYRVQVPFLPPSLTSMQLPPHWELYDDDILISLEKCSDKLFITSFDCSSLQMARSLSVLSLVMLRPSKEILPLFAEALLHMNGLRECLLWMQASEQVVDLYQSLTPTHLKSNSLQLLNIKLLPKVYAKPSLQATSGFSAGSSGHRTANSSSAIDPFITFGSAGHEAPPVGRSHCNVARCGCSGYTRDMMRSASAVASCSTPRCGHAATDHAQASDQQTRWLSVSLACPKLTHLTIAGLSSIMDISGLIRNCPRLTHLQVSLSHTPESATISHHSLQSLHVARLENLKTLHLALPKLSKLYIEACVALANVIPYPTRQLESVYAVGSSSLTPETRVRLTRANQNSATVSSAFPTKNQFPDMIPKF